MSYCLMTCSDRLRRLHSQSRQNGERRDRPRYTTPYTIALITRARSIPQSRVYHLASRCSVARGDSDRYQQNEIDNKLQVFTLPSSRHDPGTEITGGRDSSEVQHFQSVRERDEARVWRSLSESSWSPLWCVVVARVSARYELVTSVLARTNQRHKFSRAGVARAACSQLQ